MRKFILFAGSENLFRQAFIEFVKRQNLKCFVISDGEFYLKTDLNSFDEAAYYGPAGNIPYTSFEIFISSKKKMILLEGSQEFKDDLQFPEELEVLEKDTRLSKSERNRENIC